MAGGGGVGGGSHSGLGARAAKDDDAGEPKAVADGLGHLLQAEMGEVRSPGAEVAGEGVGRLSVEDGGVRAVHALLHHRSAGYPALARLQDSLDRREGVEGGRRRATRMSYRRRTRRPHQPPKPSPPYPSSIKMIRQSIYLHLEFFTTYDFMIVFGDHVLVARFPCA